MLSMMAIGMGEPKEKVRAALIEVGGFHEMLDCC